MKPGNRNAPGTGFIWFTVYVFIVLFVFLFQACEGFGDNYETLDGVWQVNENSKDFGYQAYEVSISYSGTDSSKIEIRNFYNLGSGIKVLANINIWDVSIQQATGGFTFIGTGVISGNMKQIDLSYTANDGSGSVDEVTATYTR